MTVLRVILTYVGKFSTLKKVVKFDVFFNVWENFQNFEKVRISTILFMKKRGLKSTFIQCLGKI